MPPAVDEELEEVQELIDRRLPLTSSSYHYITVMNVVMMHHRVCKAFA